MTTEKHKALEKKMITEKHVEPEKCVKPGTDTLKNRMNKRSIGSEGETIAEGYLQNNGFSIIARNFRVGKIGEIDLIARENEYICFIEVKTRKNTEFGMPSEAVDIRKQKKIKALAMIFLRHMNLVQQKDCFIRFDIVEVTYEKSREIGTAEVNLIRNAF